MCSTHRGRPGQGLLPRLAGLCVGLCACSVLSSLDDLKGAADGSVGSGGSAADGGALDAAGCPPGKKSCAAECVPLDDPNTGCAGKDCSPCNLAHATTLCVSGACAIGQCANGFEDCNGVASDGCEADLKAGIASCGACGAGCSVPHAQVGCANGKCVPGACDAGYVDCNSDMTDGCEVNTSADPSNCGGCGTVCSAPPGKSAVCNAGACALSNCVAPLADCDKDPAEACETNLDTSISSCGFCGNACSFAAANAACNSGICQLGACNTGQGNCDGNPANGCETDTNSSLAHCGGCNQPCSVSSAGTAVCASGVCTVKCSPGQGNCDGSVANGCETSLLTDANCGACGQAIVVSGSTTASNTVRYAKSTGSQLQFWTCDSESYCDFETIGLTAFGASGSTTPSNTIRYAKGSGNQLQFWTCDSESYCQFESIVLTGATISGTTSPSNSIRYVKGVGKQLQFWTCDADNYCEFETLTVACAP